MKKTKAMLDTMLLGLDIFIKENFDYVILMDGDGEDRPIEIKSLLKKIKEFPVNLVQKSEKIRGIFFQFLYWYINF